jgi:hypothetical protein
MVYVTEVSHMWDDKVYVYGGGFFIDDPPVPLRDNFRRRALVAGHEDDILERELLWTGVGARGGGSFAAIDYHGILERDGNSVAVGDTVVFGFRAQMFMTRAYAAVVEELSRGETRLVGVRDWAAHRIGSASDPNGRPARSRHRQRVRRYRAAGTQMPSCDTLRGWRLKGIEPPPRRAPRTATLRQIRPRGSRCARGERSKAGTEPILKRLEHRLSVHASGLHPDERHAHAGQPCGELTEPGGVDLNVCVCWLAIGPCRPEGPSMYESLLRARSSNQRSHRSHLRAVERLPRMI